MTAGRYYNEEGTSRPSSKQRLSPIMNEVIKEFGAKSKYWNIKF